nr:hypothetical protein [Tanacetum cinerariifolium]
MEHEHELSYKNLTRVYLRLNEHYKSVGAELKLLEPGFELDDQEWVEIETFSFDLIRSSLSIELLLLRVIEEEVGDELETGMEDVEGCLWCRDLYREEERDVAILKTKRWIVVLVSSLWVKEEDGGTRIQACFRDELDNVVEEEDGGWICFLGGNNSSGTKKHRGSNSGDGGEMAGEAKRYLDKLSGGSGEDIILLTTRWIFFEQSIAANKGYRGGSGG